MRAKEQEMNKVSPGLWIARPRLRHQHLPQRDWQLGGFSRHHSDGMRMLYVNAVLSCGNGVRSDKG